MVRRVEGGGQDPARTPVAQCRVTMRCDVPAATNSAISAGLAKDRPCRCPAGRGAARPAARLSAARDRGFSTRAAAAPRIDVAQPPEADRVRPAQRGRLRSVGRPQVG